MDWNLGTAARTLFQECRGEPLAGQKAVAHVLVNRIKDGRWGPTLGSVCLARSQFSAWGPVTPSNANMRANFRASCALADDAPELIAFAALIQAALDGEPDPTNGATFYYAASIPAPDWAKTATPCGRFGGQLFFRNVG